MFGSKESEDLPAQKSDDEEEDPNKKKLDGIKIHAFIHTCRELKDKHRVVSEKILDALGLPIANRNTIVDWKSFLRLQTILRYFTATKDQFLDFWMKVSCEIFLFIFLVSEPIKLSNNEAM